MPKYAPRAQSRSKTSTKGAAAPEHKKPAKSVTAAAARDSGAGASAASVPPHKILYCTVATADKLAPALHLRDSLWAAHGPVEFCLLLAEHPVTVARLRPQLPAVRVLAPDEVGCRQWLQMAFYLARDEYAEALRGALMRTLIREGDVVFIAPDCEVVSRLDEIEEALRTHDLVIAPPVGASALPSAEGPPPRTTLRQQHLNLDFLAVAQGAAGERFLSWWQELLADSAPAIAGERAGLVETWAVAMAATAPSVKTLSARRYHASAPAERPDDDGDGVPRSPDDRVAILRYPDATTAGHAVEADELQQRYLRTLSDSPYRKLAELPYSFANFLSGTPITNQHRLALWALVRARQQFLDNPFAAESPKVLAPDEEDPIGIAAFRARYLEQKLTPVTQVLIEYGQKALDYLPAAARARISSAIHALPSQRSVLRAYARSALNAVVPGSSDHVYNALRAAADSDHPRIRQAAWTLLGVMDLAP